jgi:hypothetical protein
MESRPNIVRFVRRAGIAAARLLKGANPDRRDFCSAAKTDFAVAAVQQFTTCNSNGDCWRTETRVIFPDATFAYHDDPWLDEHLA